MTGWILVALFTGCMALVIWGIETAIKRGWWRNG